MPRTEHAKAVRAHKRAAKKHKVPLRQWMRQAASFEALPSFDTDAAAHWCMGKGIQP